METQKKEIENNIVKVEIGADVEASTGSVIGAIELDIESQTQFVDTINAIFDEGTKKILIDIGNISYIDSSGLWALFEVHKRAQKDECKMALLSPTKDVKRVLDITKMSSKMEIFDSEDDAIDALSK